MPSPRRIRLLILAAMGITVLMLFYTSHINSASPRGDRGLRGFYDKTMSAMDEKTKASAKYGGAGGGQNKPLPSADRDRDGDIDADDDIMGAEMQERLKAAEMRAKDLANEKAGLRPDPPQNIVGVGSSADGQDGSSPDGDSHVTEEERDTEAELNSILKKSPTIIFSKTYCPHSKRAKQILQDKYSITPEPYVVELDEHPLGSNLQDALEEKTGRRTVPNILINGVSIGGADEVAALDQSDELLSKIVELGSKRIDVAKRPASRGSRS